MAYILGEIALRLGERERNEEIDWNAMFCYIKIRWYKSDKKWRRVATIHEKNSDIKRISQNGMHFGRNSIKVGRKKSLKSRKNSDIKKISQNGMHFGINSIQIGRKNVFRKDLI